MGLVLVRLTEKYINTNFVNTINMKDDEKTILTRNAQRFLKSALLLYDDKDFTSSTILYFKALFAILDLILLKEKGKIPKDHTERFRMLQFSHLEYYALLDKLYPLYRDTYTAVILEETCIKVKENVERIAQEQGIREED